ncbi:MAG: FAD-dependent oxidoreductase [Clostridia bacterium]|nr:FAD-dependent oxidoreductase [Clostridia bacterium]
MYIQVVKDGKTEKHAVSNIKFSKEYDVIVSGLGTAGSIAALVSAEKGLKVLGIESFNCTGGTTTIGGVLSYYFGCPGGRYAEVDVEVAEHQDKTHTLNRSENYKFVLENKMLDAGTEILYESSICGIYMEDDTVIGVKVITPDGLVDFGVKVLMDCTADAYVAYMAGCATVYGRETDGLTQPYTMVSGVRTERGIRTTNFDFGRVDQRDDKSLSEALIFSRSYEMSDEQNVGRLMLHMPLIGIREGRRIVAEEMVGLEDIFSGKTTKEPMFFSYADLDKHGWDVAFDGEKLGDWAIGANLGAYNITVAVPYKAIIPKKIDGILVPCRALGVDRDVSSCVRMVLDMKKAGEAAANIAHVAIKHNCRLRDIPYDELKTMLLESKCLDYTYNRGFRVDGMYDANGKRLPAENVSFLSEPSKLEEGLATLKPGVAIWSAKCMGKKCIDVLKGLLTSENENTRKHAAFALAIAGDNSGAEILREMVIERDACTLIDCRKHNQQRCCMAIYFLGRLADEEIADELIKILTDENELFHPIYSSKFSSSKGRQVEDFHNIYFQVVSNAVIALIRIADAHPKLCERVANAFSLAFEDEKYYEKITQRPKKSCEGSMVLNVKKVAYAATKRWENIE